MDCIMEIHVWAFQQKLKFQHSFGTVSTTTSLEKCMQDAVDSQMLYSYFTLSF